MSFKQISPLLLKQKIKIPLKYKGVAKGFSEVGQETLHLPGFSE